MTHDHRSRGGAPVRPRIVPLNVEASYKFGGGAKGRTLALIYQQLSYWSKFAKWRGPDGKKYFYKSQKELATETGYSEKTISRAIKALRELGLVLVEKLHKKYWRQVSFYYLPHSPFAAAEPSAGTAGAAAPVAPPAGAAAPASTKTKPNSRNASVAPAGGATGAASAKCPPAPSRGITGIHPAAEAVATSIRMRGGSGFGQNVRIQQREFKPSIKQSLQSIVEKCNAMGGL